jgi:hypothetical protein
MRKIMYCGVIAFCLAFVGCASSSPPSPGNGHGPDGDKRGNICPGQERCPNCPGKPDICVPKGSSCPRPFCQAALTCGGLAGTACPSGSTCVDDPSDSCDPAKGGTDCAGVCQAVFCGGIAAIQCPSGASCVDDPNDNCDPNAGGADCGGVCEASVCGGFAGTACPAGSTCIDDPRDSCDPKAGGADCSGLCQADDTK